MQSQSPFPSPLSQIVFPAAYSFQAVGKLEKGKVDKDAFVRGVKNAVQAATDATVLDSQVVVKPRMNGRYVSVKVTAVVGGAETIDRVFEGVQAVEGCIMWF